MPSASPYSSFDLGEGLGHLAPQIVSNAGFIQTLIAGIVLGIIPESGAGAVSSAEPSAQYSLVGSF